MGKQAYNMSFKILFVFGLLIASSWTLPLLPEDKVVPASAKAVVELGDLKCDDENVEKSVDEKVVNTENGVSASAKASVKVPMKAMKFDLKDFSEQLNAKWEEIKKQNEENKNFEKCENVDENKVKTDDESAENNKGPIKFSFRVCSTASAKASAKASSRFCSNDEVKPATDETVVAETDGKPTAVVDPIVAEADLAEPVVDEPVLDKPVVVKAVVVNPVVDEPLVVKTDEPVELVEKV